MFAKPVERVSINKLSTAALTKADYSSSQAATQAREKVEIKQGENTFRRNVLCYDNLVGFALALIAPFNVPGQ